jgi:Gpi18-like mannosyltransferase
VIARAAFSSWALVAMAVVACAVVLAPWHLSSSSVYDALDPNLLHVQTVGDAHADLAGGRALMTTPPSSSASLHVVTTLDDFAAAFNVNVQQTDSTGPSIVPAIPLQARLWFPSSGSSIILRFGSDPRHEVIAIATNSDGQVDGAVTVLGTYDLGTTYRVIVNWRKGSVGSFEFVPPDGAGTTYRVDRSSGLVLFDDRFVDLTLDSVATGGNQRIEISKFDLVIPPQTSFASKASDPRLTIVTFVIVAWFLAFASYHGLHWLLGRRKEPEREHGKIQRWGLSPMRALAVGVPSVLIVIAAYAALAPVDGHPYDRLAQESYAYVSDSYGLGSLYERTSYIPDAVVHGGQGSWSSPPFAYPPVMAYPYWLIGRAWHLAQGPIVPMQNRAFQVFWKLAFALFVLVNAAIVFYVSARARGPRWALFAAGLYALNPAMVFDAAGWGETEAIVVTALLVSTLGFVSGRPRLGWSSLVLAILLKQSALFALPAMAIYSLKKYGLQRTVTGGSFGLLVGFAAVSPLIFLGYQPATIYKSVFAQILNFATPTPIYASSDTFSIWTLVNGIRGLHGFSRIWAPYALQIAGVSFSAAGTVIFLLVVAAILWMLWRTRPERLSNEVLLLSVSGVLIAYVAFSTVASARYLLLAVPLLILVLARSPSRIVLATIGGLSIIAFISMYGVLMEIAVRGDWPIFYGLGNPTTNPLSGAIYQAYTSDVTITVLAVVLLVILQVLMVRLNGATGGTTPLRAPQLSSAKHA